MNTVQIRVDVPADSQDWCIAVLSELGFAAFEQTDAEVFAYIDGELWNASIRSEVNHWLENSAFSPLQHEVVIPAENWNRKWEESIQPVFSGPFVVRPTWTEDQPIEAGRIEILIDPKMSFGTGHHETTRLMLAWLPAICREGFSVLDAGTGTGVLAIGAARMGATSVLAFDNDPWVEENVRENLALNQVENVIAYRICGIEDIPETGFDVILANINKGVLIDYLPMFAEKLAANGQIALAGLLQTDREEMLDVISSIGFKPEAESTENEWWSVVLSAA